jgi:antitoxin component YwqK of YwqJK toxin-antitoxin module
MKKPLFILVSGTAFILSGCVHDNSDKTSVISKRYIHKYGYPVPKEEWQEHNYPGQVISVLSDGVTVTATYENGNLHGPTTYTFAHSQAIEKCIVYNQGQKVKETTYNPNSMPVQEWIQLSPQRCSLTAWYAEGCPMMIEEYAGSELIEGQYFTTLNETEARVEKGYGTRISRDLMGALLSKEAIEEGYCVKKETYYPNGSPESISYYALGKLHGNKQTFTANGEPLAVEEWVNGQLHGKATYFKNGNRYLEISYLHGQKNGTERHYIDGDTLSQEISWENDLKHGATVRYIDSDIQQQWFYAGEPVTKKKFDDYNRMDQMVADISEDVKIPIR